MTERSKSSSFSHFLLDMSVVTISKCSWVGNPEGMSLVKVLLVRVGVGGGKGEWVSWMDVSIKLFDVEVSCEK